MKKTVAADIVIIGGGVAGLWLLHRLRQQGLSVILLESAVLGGGQTHKSQGIIHGGMKYALHGNETRAAQAIANMPALWKRCLRGDGEIDLREVPVLSQHQYLWTTESLVSRIAGFVAGLTLKGNVKSLDREDFPAIFQHPQFKGQVYSLDEMVIDVHALIRCLVHLNQDAIFKIDPVVKEDLQTDENGQLISLVIHAGSVASLQVTAQKFIFTAGSGNAVILNKLNKNTLSMQKRPLHMVVVKHDLPYALYAHCLGSGVTPRMTITTHRAEDGKNVWYLGGQIAEEGVHRDSDAQIELTRKELTALFPWLDFSNAQFSTFLVNRAEALQPGGKRPDTCFIKTHENMMIAWPTKLAFAPLLANQIFEQLQQENIKHQYSDLRELRTWPIPGLATPIWDEVHAV